MRSQSAIRVPYVILGFLNSIIVLDFIIFFNTGYYAFFVGSRHELAFLFTGLILIFTFLFVAILPLRILFFSRHRARTKNKLIVAFITFALALIYGWFGLVFWLSSLFSHSVIQVTSYPSPSHHIEIVFKEEAKEEAYAYRHYCKAYKNIGIFQKQVQMKFIDDKLDLLSNAKLQREYLNAFHDPSKLRLEWSADESRLDLEVKVESEWIKGFIMLAGMSENEGSVRSQIFLGYA